MTWQELVQHHPDIANIWSLVFAACGAVIPFLVKMMLRGLFRVTMVLYRPRDDGHREAIIRAQIGRESSDKIKTGEHQAIAEEHTPVERPKK